MGLRSWRFRLIAETRLRELFTATALLIVVAITLLMGLVDLSPALGAFHHDQKLLHRVAPLAGDTAALIDATRAAHDEVSRILASHRTGHVHFDDQAWQAPDKRPDVET